MGARVNGVREPSQGLEILHAVHETQAQANDSRLSSFEHQLARDALELLALVNDVSVSSQPHHAQGDPEEQDPQRAANVLSLTRQVVHGVHG